MRTLMISTLLLGLAGAACAQGRPPQAVMERVNEMDAFCREAGGRTGDRTGLLQAVDLNSDGVADWVLNETLYQCEGAYSLFSGSGGGQISIYPGRPGGQVGTPFRHPVFELEVENRTAFATVGGRFCGQDVEGLSNVEMSICRLPIVWNEAEGTFELQAVQVAKPSQAAVLGGSLFAQIVGTWVNERDMCGRGDLWTFNDTGLASRRGWTGEWGVADGVLIMISEDVEETYQVEWIGDDRLTLTSMGDRSRVSMKRCRG